MFSGYDVILRLSFTTTMFFFCHDNYKYNTNPNPTNPEIHLLIVRWYTFHTVFRNLIHIL